MRFGPEEKRCMRIDQKQRMMRRRVRWRDSDAVGSARLDISCVFRQRLLRRSLAVKCLELLKIDLFDVSADAAFRKRKGHPRLESRNDARFHLRMFVEVVVQAIRPCIHQCLQPFGTCLVFRSHIGRVDEQFHPQIPVDLRFAFRLGQASHGVQVIGFDAIEIVFSLGVDDAEDRIRIRLAGDVRNAPIVPHDRDVLSLVFPCRGVFLRIEPAARDVQSGEEKSE